MNNARWLALTAIKVNFVQQDVESVLAQKIKEGCLTLKKSVSGPVLVPKPDQSLSQLTIYLMLSKQLNHLKILSEKCN
ncbi:hypothetical protein [sulfur-oxidizing endosymbiont of Gigantopelta aegis]|uniref:hypothetical protein n=1 Tax=sulfur-oxidizing endosymbiont of Gigantopelta aegis TaxID=2794934 RepID=UPI0018DC783D|nr:hypothetical protein [sulfur-oxidizing endosymbiont of Gigantopelta aegis]